MKGTGQTSNEKSPKGGSAGVSPRSPWWGWYTPSPEAGNDANGSQFPPPTNSLEKCPQTEGSAWEITPAPPNWGHVTATDRLTWGYKRPVLSPWDGLKPGVHTLLRGSPGIRQEPDSRCCHVLTKHLLLHPPASLTALSLCKVQPSHTAHPCLAWSVSREPNSDARQSVQDALGTGAGLLPRHTWALCGRGTPLPPITMKGRHTSYSPEHARKYPQVRFKDHRTLAHSLWGLLTQSVWEFHNQNDYSNSSKSPKPNDFFSWSSHKKLPSDLRS